MVLEVIFKSYIDFLHLIVVLAYIYAPILKDSRSYGTVSPPGVAQCRAEDACHSAGHGSPTACGYFAGKR